jgi:hypothetical protein
MASEDSKERPKPFRIRTKRGDAVEASLKNSSLLKNTLNNEERSSPIVCLEAKDWVNSSRDVSIISSEFGIVDLFPFRSRIILLISCNVTCEVEEEERGEVFVFVDNDVVSTRIEPSRSEMFIKGHLIITFHSA